MKDPIQELMKELLQSSIPNNEQVQRSQLRPFDAAKIRNGDKCASWNERFQTALRSVYVGRFDENSHVISDPTGTQFAKCDNTGKCLCGTPSCTTSFKLIVDEEQSEEA